MRSTPGSTLKVPVRNYKSAAAPEFSIVSENKKDRQLPKGEVSH